MQPLLYFIILLSILNNKGLSLLAYIIRFRRIIGFYLFYRLLSTKTAIGGLIPEDICRVGAGLLLHDLCNQ